MTEPAFHFDTGRHRLTLDGMPIPSVTGILNAIPKQDYLKPWAARLVAEFAYDHRDAWKDLPRDDAVYMLKSKPLRFTAQAARRGTVVHGAIAAHHLGLDPPEDMSDEEWGYFNAALAYLSEQKVEVKRSEATVYSRKHLYGGTFDALQTRDGGPLEIADFKTSGKVYPEVAMQLCAYARADFIGDPNTGQELELPECKTGVIVRLGADGKYEAVPVPLDDEVFATFLHLIGVREWTEGISRRVLGKPLRPAA